MKEEDEELLFNLYRVSVWEDEKVVTTQRIQPTFYNNNKRTITFTNCESLYCAPVIIKKCTSLYLNK